MAGESRRLGRKSNSVVEKIRKCEIKLNRLTAEGLDTESVHIFPEIFILLHISYFLRI